MLGDVGRGITYRLSHFETGPNIEGWLVVLQYADTTAYEKAQAAIAQDREYQHAVAGIAKIAKVLTDNWSAVSLFEQPLNRQIDVQVWS